MGGAMQMRERAKARAAAAGDDGKTGRVLRGSVMHLAAEPKEGGMALPCPHFPAGPQAGWQGILPPPHPE